MYDARTLHGREVLARVVEAFGDRVFHTVINRTVRFPETTVAGEPITTYASSSAGRRLPRLAREVLARCLAAEPARRGELFRATGPVPTAPAASRADDADRSGGPNGDTEPAAGPASPTPQPGSGASGRERHDEKITVYVSARS